MRKRKILCSTGAFIGRPNRRDWRLIPRYAETIHADGYELLVYPEWLEERATIANMLQESGYRFPVLHAEKGVGERISLSSSANACQYFEKNCDFAARLHSRILVLHLWDGPSSDQQFSKQLAICPRLNQMAMDYGLSLAVENVVCNQQDPMRHFDELHSLEPAVHFTFDTKMAAFHGQVMELYQPQRSWLFQEKRLIHMHINDYLGRPGCWDDLNQLHRNEGTHIGHGQIDFPQFFQALSSFPYEGDFTIESSSFGSPPGTIRLDLLNASLDKVREYSNGSCNSTAT